MALRLTHRIAEPENEGSKPRFEKKVYFFVLLLCVYLFVTKTDFVTRSCQLFCNVILFRVKCVTVVRK